VRWLLEVMDTKKALKEKQKVRQSLASIMGFIDRLKYSLGEIKK
jgi:hypothetical protein